jgi:uncharacterized membrane-anchored protein YhcB (DUF1043 family)
MSYDVTDYIIGLVIGIFMGAMVSGIVVSIPDNQKLRECQKELPRNQMCELVAVPQVQEN